MKKMICFFTLIFFVRITCPLQGADEFTPKQDTIAGQNTLQAPIWSPEELATIKKDTAEIISEIHKEMPEIKRQVEETKIELLQEKHRNAEQDPYWGTTFRQKLIVSIPIPKMGIRIGIYGEDLMRLAVVYADMTIKKQFFTDLDTLYFESFFDNFESKKNQLFEQLSKIENLKSLPEDKQKEVKENFTQEFKKIFVTECVRTEALTKAVAAEGAKEVLLSVLKDKFFPDFVSEFLAYASTKFLPVANAGIRVVTANFMHNKPFFDQSMNDFDTALVSALGEINKKCVDLAENIQQKSVTIPISWFLVPVLGWYGLGILFNKFPDEYMQELTNEMGKKICSFALPAYLGGENKYTKALNAFVDIAFSKWTAWGVKAYCLWSFPSQSFDYYQEHLATALDDHFDEIVEQLSVLKNSTKIDEKVKNQSLRKLLTKWHKISFFDWFIYMNNSRFEKQSRIDLGIRLPVTIVSVYLSYAFVRWVIKAMPY